MEQPIEEQPIDKKALQAKFTAHVEDGVVVVRAVTKLDLIDLVQDALKKVDPSVADFVGKILEAQRDGMDWEGVAKEYLAG